MNFFIKIYYLLKHLGPGFLIQRLGMSLKGRVGVSQRVFRRRPWASIDLGELCEAGVQTDNEGYAALKRSQTLPFLFPLGRPPKLAGHINDAESKRSPSLVERLALLRVDRCVYFFHTPSPERNNWHKNPFTGGRSVSDQVWLDLPFFNEATGDARVMWEPSRAAWAYDLARAAARDGDQAHAVEFWRWVDSWMDGNQPFDGCQWMCGQESAVRLMAVLFGFWVFEDETKPHRWGQIAKLAWATGYRIEHHIDYAISQRNNHALSEACGLMLIGYLFPEFQAASRWRQMGRRIMTQQLREQIYDDGSYIQHSFNYHRVMLQVSLLALRIAELANEPFEHDIYDLLDKAKIFLHAHIDERTGRTPNYGNNDGALALPLNECDFSDYRPVLQAVHFLVNRERLLPAGNWDEDLCWLFGDEAADALTNDSCAELRMKSSAFEAGGYYTLRNNASWAMMRCHQYRDRPAHSDQLHLDLWWQGINVLQDAGTYLYFAAGRRDVEQYFKSTRAHNTIEIDNREPTEIVSRFLMLPWLSGKIKHYHAEGDMPAWMVGERYDYDRAPWTVMHRRSVICLAVNLWVVVDDLLGNGDHKATLRWHLADWPWALDDEVGRVTATTEYGDVSLAVSSGSASKTPLNLVSGRDHDGDIQGFVSPYYNEKLPAPTLEATFEFHDKIRLVTAIQLGGSPIELTLNNEQSDSATHGEAWSLRSGESLKVVRLARLGHDASQVFSSFE